MSRNEAFLQGIFGLIAMGVFLFILLDAFNSLWVPIISFILYVAMGLIVSHRQKLEELDQKYGIPKDEGWAISVGMIFLLYWFIGVLAYYFKWEITGYIIIALTILSFVLPVFIWPKK
tara:strand:+ start:188 stop:541 length:354 start_codon:yes stop_codon:yes gene_type:complete